MARPAGVAGRRRIMAAILDEMKKHLTSAQVAEPLEDAPRRAGFIDHALHAVTAGRGMMLVLHPTRTARRDAARLGRGRVDSGHDHDRR
jgi:hypothetical protein